MDFALRYSDTFERLVRQRMRELGVPDELVGNPDLDNQIARRAFYPQESTGGGVVPGIGINVDSGILNSYLLGDPDSNKAATAWSKARLRDRIDAVIAHEYEEILAGGHEDAVRNAPKTHLSVSDAARQILSLMAETAS